MQQHPEKEQIIQTPVWSARLRWAHWLVAVAVSCLLVSGWLMQQAPALYQAARDYHLLSAWLLLAGLGLRLYLLLAGRAAEHWRDLVPGPAQRQAVVATLRFYLRLGKASLPRWYAHNPLWGPLFLCLWLLLLLQTASGLALLWGLGPDVIDWHDRLATAIAMFTLLHVAAVVLQDARGGSADISAMFNGKRSFVIKPPPPMEETDPDR